MRIWSSTALTLLMSGSLLQAQQPSAEDAAALIEKGREKALAYASSLPDFVCTEIISRFRELRGIPLSRGRTAAPSGATQWTPTDKLTVKLSYFQHEEDHKLVMINDKPTDLKYENVRTGAIGTGEFGSILHAIFEPASQADFRWKNWKSGRSSRIAVFTYQVAESRSQYYLGHASKGVLRQALVGYHGDVELDAETGEVLHFDYVAEHIPKELDLINVANAVDYQLASVGGRSFMLPARATTEMQSSKQSVKNDIEFRDYNKFDTSSTIDFKGGK